MFNLHQKCKLINAKTRAWVHGDDQKLCLDLQIEADMSNDVLIEFHSELRQFMFKCDDSPDLVDQINPDALTVPRFPSAGQMKWAWEGVGYTVRVDYGIVGGSDIDLPECTVDRFKFMPKSGGTVTVSFRIITNPKQSDVGKLCEFIKREIELVVCPPEPSTLEELFGDE